MQLSISEILEQTSQKPEAEQVEFLRKNDSVVLRQILEYALSPNIKWLLPEGKPPFTYGNTIGTHGMLYSQARKLYLFVEGGNPNLSNLKRETLFIQVLESVHPADADLIIAAKDKRIPYNIKPEVFNEAFGFQFATAPQTSPGVEIKEGSPKPKKRKTKSKKSAEEAA